MGQPVNSVDSIAKSHDIEYENAKSFEDMKNSDSKAIKDFSKQIFSSSALPATAGALGLGIKTGFERILGSAIYPRPRTLKQHRLSFNRIKKLALLSNKRRYNGM